MRPSDLLLDFGHPVAYYPGLVKYMGVRTLLFSLVRFFTGRIKHMQRKAYIKRVKRYNTKLDLHLNNRL